MTHSQCQTVALEREEVVFCEELVVGLTLMDFFADIAMQFLEIAEIRFLSQLIPLFIVVDSEREKEFNDKWVKSQKDIRRPNASEVVIEAKARVVGVRSCIFIAEINERRFSERLLDNTRVLDILVIIGRFAIVLYVLYVTICRAITGISGRLFPLFESNSEGLRNG